MTQDADPSDWPEALATVLQCKYETRAGRAIAFGLPTNKHFRITYNYWAGGELHDGECFTEKALPVGTLFPIRYNPRLPQRSRHGTSAPARGGLPLLPIAVAAAAFVWLVWMLALRGC